MINKNKSLKSIKSKLTTMTGNQQPETFGYFAFPNGILLEQITIKINDGE